MIRKTSVYFAKNYENKSYQHKKFELCLECNQLNTGGYKWCQFCNPIGNQTISDFIQKSEKIEWIPHNKLRNIKYLAEGGFGKVYKAEWIDKHVSFQNQYVQYTNIIKEYPTMVILKDLNNSQNMTINFLQEITHHTLFNDNNLIVQCYGISTRPPNRQLSNGHGVYRRW